MLLSTTIFHNNNINDLVHIFGAAFLHYVLWEYRMVSQYGIFFLLFLSLI